MFVARKVWLAALGMIMPSVARAQNESSIVKCGPGFPKGECTIQDIFILLVDIYNYLLGAAAVVAFGLLIYGAVQMFLYTVDEEYLASGKKTVMQALIGLAITALAYVIVNTLLSALGLAGSDASDLFRGTKLLGQ